MIPLQDDNPATLKPLVTVALIGLCVLAFLWQISHSEDARQVIVYALGVIPAVLLEGVSLPEEMAWIPPGLTIITSMFLHGGWGHLLGLWFVMQMLSSAMTASGGGGVAFGAHIGGFVAGMALIPFFKHRDLALQNPFGADSRD